MKPEFWNEKYQGEKYFFSDKPHPYFAEKLKKITAGKILLPADGEGRHGIYAAKLGWDVTIMDYSEKGREKAMQLAALHNVEIQYEVVDLFHADLPNDHYDAIGMVYAHFITEYQPAVHRKLWKALKKGGHLILVGFGKEQLKYSSGGPPEKGMLYDIKELLKQFRNARVLEQFDGIKRINEGDVLQGDAHQVYLHLRKEE